MGKPELFEQATPASPAKTWVDDVEQLAHEWALQAYYKALGHAGDIDGAKENLRVYLGLHSDKEADHTALIADLVGALAEALTLGSLAFELDDCLREEADDLDAEMKRIYAKGEAALERAKALEAQP